MPDQPSEGVRCVTWTQHTFGLAAVFVANAVFSLVLFALAVNNQVTQTNHQSIQLTPDPERSEMVEKLTRERLNGMRGGTAGL